MEASVKTAAQAKAQAEAKVAKRIRNKKRKQQEQEVRGDWLQLERQKPGAADVLLAEAGIKLRGAKRLQKRMAKRQAAAANSIGSGSSNHSHSPRGTGGSASSALAVEEATMQRDLTLAAVREEVQVQRCLQEMTSSSAVIAVEEAVLQRNLTIATVKEEELVERVLEEMTRPAVGTEVIPVRPPVPMLLMVISDDEKEIIPVGLEQ